MRSTSLQYCDKSFFSDTGLDAPIPLPNVSSKILAKVIEYCKYHVDAEKKADDKQSKTEEEIKTWDTDFVKVDQSTLFELILVLYWHLGVNGCC